MESSAETQNQNVKIQEDQNVETQNQNVKTQKEQKNITIRKRRRSKTRVQADLTTAGYSRKKTNIPSAANKFRNTSEAIFQKKHSKDGRHPSYIQLKNGLIIFLGNELGRGGEGRVKAIDIKKSGAIVKKYAVKIVSVAENKPKDIEAAKRGCYTAVEAEQFLYGRDSNLVWFRRPSTDSYGIKRVKFYYLMRRQKHELFDEMIGNANDFIRLPHSQQMLMILGLLQVVSKMHLKKRVFGDLKPENIMIIHNLRTKIYQAYTGEPCGKIQRLVGLMGLRIIDLAGVVANGEKSHITRPYHPEGQNFNKDNFVATYYSDIYALTKIIFLLMFRFTYVQNPKTKEKHQLGGNEVSLNDFLSSAKINAYIDITMKEKPTGLYPLTQRLKEILQANKADSNSLAEVCTYITPQLMKAEISRRSQSMRILSHQKHEEQDCKENKINR